MRLSKRFGAVLVLGVSTAVFPASGLDLDRQVIAGGGGTSSGGGFSLSGTVGQAVAADPSQGGPFSLAGGFWNGLLLFGPRLSATFITPTGEVRISWPLSDDGFVLERSSQLLPSGSNWSAIPPGTYESDETSRFVTLPAVNPGIQLFRLARP